MNSTPACSRFSNDSLPLFMPLRVCPPSWQCRIYSPQPSAILTESGVESDQLYVTRNDLSDRNTTRQQHNYRVRSADHRRPYGQPLSSHQAAAGHSSSGHRPTGLRFGGVLLAPWFDRDLSIAGRISACRPDGTRASLLVDFKRPVASIPSLAIHLNRDIHKIAP